MAIQAALEQAVHAVAPNAVFDLTVVNGRLSGLIIAPEFEPLTHLERQRQVWNRIRADLGADSMNVGLLLLYSPEEADAVSDEEQ